MPGKMNNRLEWAQAVAVEAGQLAVRMRTSRPDRFAQRKSHQDFVTAADLAVEDLIRQRIGERYPEDAILGEEKGATGAGGSVWIIDPIDGTSNFMRGLPDWAVSIGYCRDARIECAVVYAPDMDLLGAAQAGCGAAVNSREARVSDCRHVEEALVLLGRSARDGGDAYPQQVQNLIDIGMEYRRNGSAAYSLLTLAAGRVDAFFEAHLNPWDAVAGILLVEEAGGRVDYPPYAEFIDRGGPVLASNSKLHEATRAAICKSCNGETGQG